MHRESYCGPTHLGREAADLSLSVEESSSGGYIVSGQTESYGNGNDDVYMVRVDEVGNLLWEKTFGLSQSDAASSIVETPDGGFIFAENSTIIDFSKGEAEIIRMGKGTVEWIEEI